MITPQPQRYWTDELVLCLSNFLAPKNGNHNSTHVVMLFVTDRDNNFIISLSLPPPLLRDFIKLLYLLPSYVDFSISSSYIK